MAEKNTVDFSISQNSNLASQKSLIGIPTKLLSPDSSRCISSQLFGLGYPTKGIVFFGTERCVNYTFSE
ncbi:hypothetical protein DLM78_13445 [Leptospira stimsonii]|uniref:Uncharacterized protein n=1 Tax=Leptospira stimsonii TaxID=2202203 RepID=A0A8B3CUU1_9LEPT|nr:hypothetical protein DLM78_13445 [Leptospira stimsonii]